MKERTPSIPPVIQPLPPETIRPQWSVMIPAYNCSRYLAETLESVLMQAPAEDVMQIEVIDDCSTDANVEELVMRIGKGRVKYYRQKQNVGSLRNFETCINRAKGYYIHLLHGDDKVHDQFYKEIQSIFDLHPEAGAAFTDFFYMDDESNIINKRDHKILDKAGVPKNWLLTIAQRQRVQPPAMVIKREVYEKIGSFYAVHYGEDWEMWVRIAANYTVVHSPAFLAYYRAHFNNITGRALFTGQNIIDIKKVIDIIQNHLPTKHRKRMKKEAKKEFCHVLL